MTKDELQKVRDWADQKITTGAEPPWSWFQYMKLREVTDQILSAMSTTAVTQLPASSPVGAVRRGNGHLRVVSGIEPEKAQHHPIEIPVQLRM